MRLKSKMLVMGLCMLVGMPLFAKSEIMVLNGSEVVVDTKEENNTKLIPLRQVGDMLGLTTNYYADTNTIKLIRGFYSPAEIGLDVLDEIHLTIGSTKCIGIDYPEDKIIEMSVPPKAIDGITYVPLRTIAETMNFQVDYRDGKTYITQKTVNGLITDDASNKKEIWETLSDVPNARTFYNDAVSVVKTLLKDPFSAQFDPNGTILVFKTDEGDVVVSGTIHAKNSYGAFVKSTYDVKFYQGNWMQYSVWMDGNLEFTNQY